MPQIVNFISPIDLSLPCANVVSKDTGGANKLVNFKVEAVTKTSTSSFMNKISYLVNKVKEVAQFILMASFSTLLFWVNPSLFAIGFIAGIVLDDQVKHAILKIKTVWNNQKIMGTLIGGFACALSMPVSLATASILWSAHLGSAMHV